MQVRWVLLAVATLLINDAISISKASKEVWSTKSENNIRRLISNEVADLKSGTVADKNATADESDGAEERLVDLAMVARMEAKMDDIKVEMMFRHWFQGGKTLAYVRTLLSLPAKGEAVTYAHWSMYLKYLDFYKEQQAFAAAVAKAETAKLRPTYWKWFIDRKSFKQVREMLDLPATGDAVGYANWQKFLDYVKFHGETSKLESTHYYPK